MVFSSLTFLCAFLPVVLALYLICPKSLRNLLLAAVSLVFYAWGEPVYIFIMLFSTVFDYINGRMIEYFEHQNKQQYKKYFLILSVIGNLGILFFFKYTDMLLSSWNRLTDSDIALLELALPIGISFYTFQTMSYTIDVYRGIVKAQHNIISFAMYVCMFPQLIAGPIVRYQDIENQIQDRKIVETEWVQGMRRFFIGLGKKVIFANQIGCVWQEISGGNLDELSVAGAWLGAFAYTFQIYFDFSGYSDMAIGLGQMFGFSFPENFCYPYESMNITEFWRRWHITLGRWFREYVYIPLGGNRKGLKRQILNLLIVWLLTGLWHGASWNFALWGLYYFVLLFIEKVFLLKKMEQWPLFLRHIYGKFFIIIGWVIFALEDFAAIGGYFKALFGIRHTLVNETAFYQWSSYGVLMVILLFASTRIPIRCVRWIKEFVMGKLPEAIRKRSSVIAFIVYGFYTICILFISLSLLVKGSYNPFLYFRF